MLLVSTIDNFAGRNGVDAVLSGKQMNTSSSTTATADTQLLRGMLLPSVEPKTPLTLTLSPKGRGNMQDCRRREDHGEQGGS